jgi:hypothetical protein
LTAPAAQPQRRNRADRRRAAKRDGHKD